MTPSLAGKVLESLTTQGGHPAVTWYDTDGGRLELSGYVLSNWVSKTTNLLVDEYTEPETKILFDIPAHWRTMTWLLASWLSGAHAIVTPAAPDTATIPVVVTDTPERWPTNTHDVLAVTLAGLARRFSGELPAGAIDAGPAVMGCSDMIGWLPNVADNAPALTIADRTLSYAELDNWVGENTTNAVAQHAKPQSRIVLVAPDTQPTTQLIASLLTGWQQHASMIVTFAAATRDLDRLATSEYATEVVTLNSPK